jgi:hypothetical protein
MADSLLLPNGGFETGTFQGWTTIGDVSLQTAAFGTPPAGGIYQALITNGPSYVCSFPGGTTCEFGGTYSGIPSVGVFPSSPYESFLRSPSGALLAWLETQVRIPGILEASALGLEFTTTNAFDTLTFDYNFLTDETPFGIEDLAFYVLDGTTFGRIDGWPTQEQGTLSPTSFLSEFGYKHFSIPVPTAGSHFLALGVTDLEDPTFNSGLLVDNVRLTPVPEPSTWVLFGTGLVFLGWRKFRR